VPMASSALPSRSYMVKPKSKYSIVLMGLAYLSFVSLGLPDGLNGVAWPSIRAHFSLPLNALGSLLLLFTVGYLASSFCSGRLLEFMSLGSLLALSCFATALSLIGYAISPTWWVMVALGAIAGLGAGGIDAGLNTFAAIEFSPRMVNWLHACYGVGAATGPIIMTRVLAANHPWQWGYAIVGCWQLLLAACFGLTRRSWAPPTDSAYLVTGSATRASNSSTLRLPIIWLSIAVFFLYTGIEAAAGVWAYTLFTESRGVSMMSAGLWVTVYWGGLTVGRLAAGVALGFVSANRLLRFHVAGMAVGAALIWLNATTLLSVLGLGLMGLASASVFPSLIATTPGRLGPMHTSNGIGFQIAAAALGQSFLPAFTGVLAGKLGLEIIGPSIFVACLALLSLISFLTSTNREINGTPASLGPIANEPSQHI
jgi:fucose permease